MVTYAKPMTPLDIEEWERKHPKAKPLEFEEYEQWYREHPEQPYTPPSEEMKLKFYVIGEKGWGVSKDYETFVSPKWEKFSLAEMQPRLSEIGMPVIYDFERDMFVPVTEEQVQQREQASLELEAQGLTLPKRIEELPATIEEYNTRITEERAKTEQAIQTVFPEATLDDVRNMLSEMTESPEKQDEFLQAIRDIGKTPETELLIWTTFPQATNEDIDIIFGVEPPAEEDGYAQAEQNRLEAIKRGESHYWVEVEKSWKLVSEKPQRPKVPEVSAYQKLNQAVIDVANAPLFTVGGITVSAADIVSFGLMAYGAYATVTALYNVAMEASLRRNLNSWAKSAGVEIPKETKDSFISFARQNLSTKFQTKEAIKTLFKSTKAGYTLTEAGAKATEVNAQAMVRQVAPLLPTFTPGGTAIPGQTRPLSEIMTGAMAELEIPKVPGEIPPETLAIAKAKFPLKPPITGEDWGKLSIPDRIELVKSLGMEGKVASKSWDKLTSIEKRNLTTELVERVTPEVTKPDLIQQEADRLTKIQNSPEYKKAQADWSAAREKYGLHAKETLVLRDKLLSLTTPARIVKVPLEPEVSIPKAEAGMPEAGIQPSMIEEVAGKRVFPKGKGVVTQISMEDQLKLEQVKKAAEEAPPEVREAYEAQAEAEGLKVWLEGEPAAKLTNLIKKTGWYKGEIKNLTKEQYRDLTGKEARPSILGKETQVITSKAYTTKAGKRILEKTYKTTKEIVRWEYALDDIATELGYADSDTLKAAIEQAGEAQTRIKELEKQIARVETERPLEVLPEPEEVNLTPTGGKVLTPAQVTRTLDLFSKYIEDPSTLNAWEITRELRRETRSQRAELLKARAQELIIEKDIPAEDAMKQAISEALSGELPALKTDYLSDLTDKMRDALFNKVYQTLKDEPFEMASTVTALTNALTGQPIPREPGVKGGSAFTRLQRVFGDQPKVMEAIDKIASSKKSLQNVVEALYFEVGKPPLPIDQETAEYLRKLASVPYGLGTLFEKPSDLRVSDLRTPAEVEYAHTKLELGTQLAEGKITKDAYDIALSEARGKAYPTPPITKFELPIEDAFKQSPLMPMAEKQMLVRLFKEIGWTVIDIGNFLRANMASIDNSFLRQSKVLATGHPLIGFAGHTAAWKAMFSQKSTEAEWELIVRDPDFQIYEEIRSKTGADPLRVPAFATKKGTAQWRTAEEYGFPTVERAIPRFTAKIPWIKLSERAFSAGTNKIAWGVWKLKLRLARRMSEKIASGQMKLPAGEAFDIVQEMTDHQEFLADAIQRATLRVGSKRVEGLAPAMGAIFFAARSKLARFIFPRHLISSNPRVRAEAWRDFILMNAFWGGLMLLGDWLDLWDTEKDPRNAEFMSARIGKIRIDPWAGYRQFVVLYARLVTGTGISSVTGAEYEVNKLGALQNFIRGSLAPMPGILLDFWTGRNFLGQVVEITNAKQWLERLAPFSVQNMWEAFEEEGVRGVAIGIIPAIYGEGVQIYTGDWEENWTKLGLPKYLENTAYGITEPKYDIADFWADTAGQFKDVDPETLTEKKGYPKYIKAIAETRIIKEHLDTLPNEKLAKLNADPAKGLTFTDYRRQWLDREKLIDAGDKAEWTRRELQPDGKYKDVTYKGEDALKVFDSDERTRNANLGNFSQRQFALLNEYWTITDKKKQAEFLEQHKDEIGINLRQDYLRTHPKENAELAIWGQAKILTKEAYNQFKGLLKTLDIPDSAIPELTLPPETSIETHFKYEEMVEDGKHGSWEAQLLLLKDAEAAKKAGVKSYAEWKGLTLSETPPQALELKVKHHDLFDLVETYKDKESTAYIADEKAREDAIKKLKTDNPDWVDDTRRIEAIENKTPDEKTTEAWVERGHTIDKFGGGSSEAKVWLIDHPDIHGWALEQKLLEDDGTGWNIPVLRINVKYRTEDKEYNDNIPDRFKNITNLDERADKITKAREDYLLKNIEYYKDRYRRDAYSFTGEAPAYKKFPANQIETYVKWNTNASLKKPKDWKDELGWYEDDWFLIENKTFYDTMIDLGIWKEPRDFSKTPTREVFAKWQQYNELVEGKPRDDFRWENRDLDAWLLLTKKVTVSIEEKRRRARLSASEKVREQLKKIEELLK